MKTLFMETTRIGPAQTVGEIQSLLGKYGASAIRTDYEGGEVISVSFTIEINRNQIPFRLPCRWEPVLKILLSRIKGHKSEEYLENKKMEYTFQAKRIAWRQILRWIEAQLALVETGMVKLQEVFMPYLLIDKGQTIYERFDSQNWKFQLEHKKER